MDVFRVVARQVTRIVDLQPVAEIHGDDLLSPALVHLVVGPDGAAEVAGILIVADVTAEETRADVPAGRGFPIVIDASHDSLAVEEGPLGARHHETQVLLAEIAYQAQCAERAPGGVVFFRGEQAVLGGTEAAVEFERRDDVAQAFAVVGRAADAPRVQQLAVIGRCGEFEQPLVLGEERALVAEEGFGGVEVDHEVVAFHLAEIRIHRRGQLQLAIGFPEDVDSRVGLAFAAEHVVQAGGVRRDGQQRLIEARDFNGFEIRQEARALEARHRPARALAGGTGDAIQVDAEDAFVRRVAHGRDVPRDEHLHAPALGVRTHRMAPVAVPIVVEGILVGDDGVGDAVGGRHREVVARAVIAIEIEHHVDAIYLLVEIALHALQGARHGRGVRIAEGHGEALGGRQYPGFGRQRGRFAVEWLHLPEIGDVPGVLPFRRVDPPIYCQRAGHRAGREGQQQQTNAGSAHFPPAVFFGSWMRPGAKRLSTNYKSWL